MELERWLSFRDGNDRVGNTSVAIELRGSAELAERMTSNHLAYDR